MGMNKIRQHVPNFVDIDRDKIRQEEFETQEELLEILWIKKWSANERFYRYSVNSSRVPANLTLGRKEGYCHYLMVERDEGRWWWVVGSLDSLDGISLPKWEPIRDE